MKENYIISAFRETVKRDFAGRAQVLNEAFDGRLQSLRQENADASKEKQRHLEGQILPGIAAYETCLLYTSWSCSSFVSDTCTCIPIPSLMQNSESASQS